MNKKKLQILLEESYIKENLDEARVKSIAEMLNRQQLKEYIKALKEEEDRKTVNIYMPFEPKSNEKRLLEEKFPNKKIVYNVDPSLILGIKIVDQDKIYDYNLKGVLSDIVTHVSKSL